MTRPRGTPPTPRAISSTSAPVEMTSTWSLALASPRLMMEPLPNCFSIWVRARSEEARREVKVFRFDPPEYDAHSLELPFEGPDGVAESGIQRYRDEDAVSGIGHLTRRGSRSRLRAACT